MMTGMAILFGFVPSGSIPAPLEALLNPDTEFGWYAIFGLDTLMFENMTDEEAAALEEEKGGWFSRFRDSVGKGWDVITSAGFFALVGSAATLAGIWYKNEYLIWGPAIFGFGAMVLNAWWGLLIIGPMSAFSPLNLLFFGVITFLYVFATIEWMRGRI